MKGKDLQTLKKIGIISDTHGFLDGKILDWFRDIDEIWHAGDMGSIQVLRDLQAFKPLRAVYGNIDGQDIRQEIPEEQWFQCGKLNVWMTHIGGYPGKYRAAVRKTLEQRNPGIFVCGHSHILKVMYDSHHHLMYMNPGAAGRSGLHQVRTALRFSVRADRAEDLEVLELKRNP